MKAAHLFRVILATTTLCASPTTSVAQQLPTTAQLIQRDEAAARNLAKPELTAALQRCDVDDNGSSGVGKAARAVKGAFQPTKAFDQLYYVGGNYVGSWALNTPDGIILFDTMNNTDDVKNIIEPGLRQVGLDPTNIKYVVIMHGHGDHYGGAKYIQDTYKPRVLMSAADWAAVAKLPAEMRGRTLPPPPHHDTDVTDGMELTLGGETVKLYLTPGHTVGTIAAVFPVTDRGAPHMVTFIGGTGFLKDPEMAKLYLSSFRHLTSIGWLANSDAVISNHPWSTNGLAEMFATTYRGENDPNPFVIGEDGFLRFMGAYDRCLTAVALKLSLTK